MNTSLRVLHIESDPDFATRVKREFKNAGLTVKYLQVDSPPALAAALLDGPWDLVLASYRLAGFKKPAGLAQIAKAGLDLPYIVLADPVGEKAVSAIFKAGASDYILKNDLNRLVPAVKRQLRRASLREKNRKDEEEFERSERKYRVLFDCASDALFITDFSGRIRDANKIACVRYGYSHLELLKKKIVDFDPAESAESIRAMTDQIKRLGGCIFEREHVNRNGRRIPVEVSARIIDFDGEKAVLSIVRDVSERKQAEDEIRKSEERHRELVANISEILYTLNLDETITYISPSVRSFGYEPEELIGRSVYDFFHPEDRALLKQNVRAVIRGAPYSTEYRILHKNGEYRWIRTSSRPLHAGQKITGLQGLLFDVTDRKMAEAALRESEERYRGLVENVIIGIGIAAESNVLFANRALLDILGVATLEELVGHSLFEYIHPHSRSLIKERLQKSRAGEIIPPLFEFDIIRRDGAVRTLLATSSEFQAAGRAVMHGVFQDVTDQKHSDAVLHENEERLSVARTAAGLGIYDYDGSQRVIHWDARMREIWGLDPAERITYRLLKFSLHPTDREPALACLRAALNPQGTGKYDAEFRVRSRRDGRERWIAAAGQVFFDRGRVWRLVGIVQDVTERKRADAALRESEERFRIIFQDAAAGMVVVAPDFRFLSANSFFCRMLGYSEDELLAKTFQDVTFPEDRPIGAELVGDVLAGRRKMFRLEKRYVRKDGHVIWGMVSSVLIRDDAGQPLHFITQILDVTDRRLIEKRLTEEQVRTAAILAGVADTFYSLDAEWRFTVVNPAAEKAPFGRPAEELLGRVIWDLYPNLIGTDIHRHYLAAAAGRALEHYEAQSPLNARWYEVFMQGWAGGVDAYMRDITDRKRAEEALRLREAQLTHAMKIADLGDWEYDVASDLFTFNDNFFALFRTTAGKVGGYTMRPQEYADRFLHPEDRALVAQETAGALTTPDPHYSRSLEHRIIHDDGSIGYVTVRIFIIKDEHGKTVKTYGVNQNITARKQAEEALRLSEEQLSLARAAAEIGIYDYDAATGTIQWDQRVRELLGVGPEEKATFALFKEIVDPADLDSVSATLREALDVSGGGKYEREFRVRHRRDGRIRWLFATGRVFFSQHQAQRLVGTVQDVTARKRADEELRTLSLRYQAILSSVPDIIMETDNGKIYTWANEAGRQFFGDDVIGREAASYFEGAQDTYARVGSLFAGDEDTVYVESWQRRRDGEKRLLAWWCRALKDDYGRVTGSLSTAHDITERKVMEETLRESEERYRLLHESAGMAIGYYSPDGTVLSFNTLAAKNMGGAPEDFTGRSVHELFPKADAEFYFDRMKKAIASDAPQEYEDRLDLPVGALWMHSTYHRVADAAGRVIGIQIISADITERKRMEDALHWELSLNSALAELSLPLNAPDVTIDGIARVILDRALQLTLSANGFAALIDPPTGECLIYASDVLLAEAMDQGLPQALPRTADGKYPGLMGYALTTRTAFIANDTARHPAYVAPSLGHVPFERFLAVPVFWGTELLGQIALANPGRDYTERDLAAVRRLADFFALAVQSNRAEAQVQASLKEKILLLKEIHHRIKNNLQVVMSLLNLQTYHLTDPKAQALFRENQLRIRAMALVHERLYQSSDLSHVDFKEYITKLAVDLFRAYRVDVNTIRLQVKADDVTLGIDTSVPCGLIINELLLNSLKHAFPRGRKGRITVSLERYTEDQLLLTIADDGVGLDKNVDFYGSKSLGFSLVVALTEQLGGTLRLSREAGTKIEILFRAKE